jgi:hypothetical protein
VNKEIRWRIISLQALLVVVLASASGFLFFEGNFVTTMVQTQLSAQKISFPTTTVLNADAAVTYSQAMHDYAGQQVDNGDKAKVYANDYIGVHLQGVAAGKTYSDMSSLSRANPTDATMKAQVETLFKGEMLRATLLNSWGWWTMGVYSTYVGIGLLVAALAALSALVFELFVAGRKPETFKVAQKIAA